MSVCTLYSRSIGWVPVDLFIEEQHESELEIAQHLVEKGTDISDHAWLKPSVVTISGAIQSMGAMAGYQALRQVQAARQPFDLITGLELYSNMLIQELSATRDAVTGQVCSFEVKCQEAIIVSTETSSGDGSGYDRASSTQARGLVQAREQSGPDWSNAFAGGKAAS